ncbi:hypothetical protein L345_04925, partial [Ophiophagus hannah]
MCLHFGFYGWILYSPEVLMYFFFNVTEPSQLPDPSTQLFFLELAIDLFPLGALVGSLMSGYMADRFGRKGSLALLREYYNPITFQVITHPKFKLLELAIIVSIIPLGGIFASVMAGFLADILGRKGCLVVANITAMTSAVLMSVLKMLRETDDVEDEIIELYQEDLAEGNNKDMTPLKLIRTPNMQLQIITIVVVVAGAQLSGISLMYLVDSVGRRPLLLGSFAGCIITSILLIVSLLLQKMVKELTYFSSVALILFICTHDMGAESEFIPEHLNLRRNYMNCPYPPADEVSIGWRDLHILGDTFVIRRIFLYGFEFPYQIK